jgi:hypothetical protein
LDPDDGPNANRHDDDAHTNDPSPSAKPPCFLDKRLGLDIVELFE